VRGSVRSSIIYSGSQALLGTSNRTISWQLYRTSSGYCADFSIDSLRDIDRFFDEHSRKGEVVPGGLLAERFGSRIFAIGSYVGETIRLEMEEIGFVMTAILTAR